MKSRFVHGSLTSNGLLSIGSQVAWGAQGFITFVMAGRMLPPKEFGFIVVANTILFGSQCLLLGPITNPTLRFGAISEKSLLLTYWIYCAVTGLVCSGFLLFGAQLGRIIYPDPSFFTLIKFLGIPFATTSFYAVQKLVLFARARYKIVLSMDVIYASSNIVILFLLHSNGRLSSAIGFYLSRSGAAVIGLLPVLCLFTWSTYQESPELEKHFSYRDYLQHSKYSSISMLSSYGQSQVDTLAVAHFLTPLNAATYRGRKDNLHRHHNGHDWSHYGGFASFVEDHCERERWVGQVLPKGTDTCIRNPAT